MLVFIAGFVAIETIICTVIVLTNPVGGLKDVVYSDMKNEAFMQCKLASYTSYSTALWWGYNSGLVLVCTYQAFLTRKVPRNYNEARFIAFNMMTISTDVLMFFSVLLRHKNVLQRHYGEFVLDRRGYSDHHLYVLTQSLRDHIPTPEEH